MPNLISGVDYEIVRAGYKYRLLKRQICKTGIKPLKAIKHEYFSLALDGTLTAEPGYEWDGPSGGLDTANFMRGSLFHDIGCQCIKEGLLSDSYRKPFDKLLYKILGEDGMLGIRRLWVYNAIRLYVRIRY